jgi:N-glycosylase/DNA lyase
VKQLLDKYYADGFDFDRYAGFAGIIQQYLFYYELLESGK